ncbi:MAG: hypothetical protein ACU837_04750 [Gammaproteobacteria bacterium]
MFKKSLSLSLLLAATFNPGSNTFAANDGGTAPLSVAPGSLRANHGQVLCTAAINDDATVAGGLHVIIDPAQTKQAEGVGTYQVAFSGPCRGAITAKNGWARWVQVDTLQTGSIHGVFCTTADRSGVKNAVWVECVNNAGDRVNTSFFLFVAR